MNQLKIEGTQTTPRIELDGERGFLSLAGISAPENVSTFYDPILDWAREYVGAPAEHTLVLFDFDYFNTSSSKMLLKLLAIVKVLTDQGRSVTFEWHHNPSDIDMQEAAEDYATLLQIPLKIVPRLSGAS